MTFKLVEPQMAFMRELAPEVPAAQRAMLSTGDTPDEFGRHNHPLAVLFRDRWSAQRCDRREAARRIAGDCRHDKCIRRIDELLAGRHFHAEWVARLAAYLGIAATDMESARAAAEAWHLGRDGFRRMRSRHKRYAWHGPYLLALTAPDLQRGTGRRVAWNHSVPCLLEVHGTLSEPGLAAWMKDHAGRMVEGLFPVAGWMLLAHPLELTFFEPDGGMIASGGPDIATPPGLDEPVARLPDD